MARPGRRVERTSRQAAGRARACRRAHAPDAAARRWLRAFQRCVRALDYRAARPLFAAGVYAFGTYAGVVRGRAALERTQWKRIWPTIRRFTFRLTELRCVGGGEGLCVIVPWDSAGVRPDGTTFPRPGRATLLLVPDRRRARWVAVHSHFSLAPGAASPSPPRR